jgi:hypothetical protein
LIRLTERSRSSLVVSAAVALVACLAFAPQVWAASRAAFAHGAPRSGAITTASSSLLSERLSASLQVSAKTGATRLVDVLVVQKAGTGRPTTLKIALRVNLKGDPGHEYWAGRVAADHLAKLASGAGVEFVADNGRQEPPVVPDVTGPSPAADLAAGKRAVALLKQATASGVVRKFAVSVNADAAGSASIAGGAGQPTDWFEVGPTHKSALAWANGFTGAGVKVAVDDDGVDFGHPDLQGTQAYITDPSSPYVGWPMAFDPYSTYLYALDQITGSTNVADGNTWFSSTDATLSEASPVFSGSPVTLPGTSKSGIYHIGFLWDHTLSTAKWFGEFPLLLVADEHTAGVYDTVYVDLNDDRDFTNDKACTKESPISYLDYVDHNGNPGTDGVADLSGGMVYWISDGTNDPPYADQVFSGLGSAPGGPPAAGTMVCMMGAYDAGSDHGTLCASDIVGQGRIDGPSVAGVHPSFKTGSGGMVQGGGRNASLVGIGDIYNAYALSTLLAADFSAYGPDATAGSGDEAQIVSNSYGESSTDNDEWDFASRYITLLNTGDAPDTTFLFATGNGGPGYGTNTAPAPSTAIKVGASTQFGADGGWDSIDTSSQVTFGDVIPFSNRGPTAMGHLAPTVVADGAYAAGSVVLSMATGNGWRAWDIWGGTSRSTPVASGNLALVFQAFKDAHARWPRWDEARALLASGATDLNYDTLVQGAGMVDADRSTRLASGMSGAGVEASPTAWYPGGFDGPSPVGFAQTVHAGDTVSASLTLTNIGPAPVDVAVTDSWMQRTGSVVVTVTLDPSRESPYTTLRPDALVDLSSLIPTGTQLLVARATIPFSEFDSNNDGIADNAVRMLAYDWTDRNGNGRLWNDANANGAVNTGEIDLNEYMRFTYSLAEGSSFEIRVQDPLGRSHDGIFLGLQQATRHGAVHVRIELSYWNRADMPWLSSSLTDGTVPSRGTLDTTMRCSVPATAPLGTYEGEYRLSADGTVTVVPVEITVAGTGAGITYGGASPYEQLMDSSKMFGYQDWSWRAEAGEWRFLSTDVASSEAGTGALWLAHTSWETTPTDIDTLLYGPAVPDPSRPTDVVGPYDLEWKGGSPNTNTGAGVWTFNTSTGGPEDWVSGPLSAGLNEILLHNVVYSGASIGERFSGETGVLRASRTSISLEDTAAAHDVPLTFSSTLALPSFRAIGYGLSPVYTTVAPITQDGIWTHEFDVAHGGYIEASVANATSDIDLYLDVLNGAGWTTLAASETPLGNEYLKVLTPADGHYRIRVFGYDVAGGTDSFSARLAVPQGTGVTVDGLPDGPVSAGTTVALDVRFSAPRLTLDERDSELLGVVGCGPTDSANAAQVPISLTYPLFVEQALPSAGTTHAVPSNAITVRFSRRIDPASLTPDTFRVTANGEPVVGAFVYDASTATVRFGSALLPDVDYAVSLTSGIVTLDGTALEPFSWTFGTVNQQLPTGVTLSFGASSVRYGSRVGFTVRSSRTASGSTSPDTGAPVALRFRATGTGAWTTMATGVTGPTGVWTGSVVGSRPGSWMAVRVASASGLYSASSARSLGVNFAVTISTTVTTVRHGRSIKVTAKARPSAQASRRSIRLEIYSGGRWVLAHYVRLNSSGNATFYEQRATRGTRKLRLRLSSGKGYGTGISGTITLRWN